MNRNVVYRAGWVTSTEFRRWLKKRGCTFRNHRGGSGHLTVRRDGRISQLPIHGATRELGPKLIEKIKKDLGLR